MFPTCWSGGEGAGLGRQLTEAGAAAVREVDEESWHHVRAKGIEDHRPQLVIISIF